MQLSEAELDDLIEEQEEVVFSLMEDGAPEEHSKRIAFEIYLDMQQALFGALIELRAWRAAHPEETMEQVFLTPYGPTVLQ